MQEKIKDAEYIIKKIHVKPNNMTKILQTIADMETPTQTLTVQTDDGIVGLIVGLSEIDCEKDQGKVLTPEKDREIDRCKVLTPRKYCKIDRDKVLRKIKKKRAKR